METLSNPYALRHFVEDVGTIVRSAPSEAELLRALKPKMEKLLRSPGSVPEEAFTPRKDRFANTLLHRPPDKAFSITGGTWAPGQTTPIHDHLTWAVVGVYEGEERESIFRRTDDGSDPARATLELASERINRRGHVTVLGEKGIHRIDNVSARPSHSVHVYGRDIGTLDRHSYDPVSGEISRFVSGYCNVLREVHVE